MKPARGLLEPGKQGSLGNQEPRHQAATAEKKKEEKLTKVGGDATPKSHTAVTKDLSGFVVSESAPSPPIDSCKREFLGAGPG